MERLKGRTALVTGASRGIGRAIAERLASEGADVLINYAKNEAAANEVADSIRSMGRQSEVFRADVADRDAVDRMCKQVLAQFPSLDILVNNAGVGSASVNRPSIVEASVEDWETVLGPNFWGAVYLCKALVPALRKPDRSDVVMISSVGVQTLRERSGVYSVSKAAMETMALTLAKEEQGHGIRVNIVAPGLVDTEMGQSLMAMTRGTKEMQELDESSPFGFVCKPVDIAAGVAYLCSEDARYVTGQRLTIDGGRT